VASLAFDEAAPVLDGNTMRVGARILAMEADPRSAAGRRSLEAWISGLMEGESPGVVNEALMELGATVCTPTQPDCRRCPLAGRCRARKSGRQEDFPPPRRRRPTVELVWVAACCIDSEGSWLLRRIDEGPILQGLWLPPLADLVDDSDPVAEAGRLLPETVNPPATAGPPVRHNITHRKIDVLPVRLDVDHFDPPSEDWRWVDPRKPDLPTSSLLAKLVDAFTR
jgi:A/G-specific adenine glycosylase